MRAKENRLKEASRPPVTGTEGDDRPEPLVLLGEELDRLPDRYRAAILLCELEGMSRREAAGRLGLAEGTLSSRLARGKSLLRERLRRRGLTLGVEPLTVLVGERIAPALPSELAASTAKMAAAGAGGPAPAAVAVLAREVLRTMRLAKLTLSATVLVLAVTLGGFAVAIAARSVESPKPDVENAGALQEPAYKPAASRESRKRKEPPATEGLFAPYTWRGRQSYEPPNFDRFFPDDPAGGKALDEFWTDENLKKRPAAEILRIVRQGLRRTTRDRDEIIGFIGNTYIWSAPAQNPDAVELIYHAADFRGPFGEGGDTAPIYYGLSVIRPKSRAVLRASVEWCMRRENRSDWGRIAWRAAAQRAELLSYLKPYLESKDEATRDKANMLVKVLGDAPDRADALTRWIKKTVRARSGHRLPAVREALRKGTSQERLEAIRLTQAEELCHHMDDSFIEAFAAAASDHDSAVRKELTRVLSMAAWTFEPSASAKVVDLLIRLSQDENREVRYYAVYQGLTPVPAARREAVVRRLVTLALAERRREANFDFVGRIAWGLSREHDEVITVLDEFIQAGDPAQAEAAKALQPRRGDKAKIEFEDLTGRRFTVSLSSDYHGWYIPRLPVPRQGIEDGGADVQWVTLDRNIGYIHVRRMRQGLEASLDQALNSLGDLKGLIVDVRGNSGGGFEARTAFENFDNAGEQAANRHRPHYDGPIALLIDERCISAGEGWASWFVANKRARLFGTTTAGASSRKETYTLTNGMYKVVDPVKAYTGFLERPIERRGIEPDVEVRCNARDLAEGRDTVAETALRWLVQVNARRK